MSVARIETVKKSMNPQGQCGHCHIDLPKGSAYIYFYVGFRSNFKHVRCASPACSPRPSERESSKLSEVYAAQEEAEDALDSASADSSAEEITEIVTEMGDRVQEVAVPDLDVLPARSDPRFQE